MMNVVSTFQQNSRQEISPLERLKVLIKPLDFPEDPEWLWNLLEKYQTRLLAKFHGAPLLIDRLTHLNPDAAYFLAGILYFFFEASPAIISQHQQELNPEVHALYQRLSHVLSIRPSLKNDQQSEMARKMLVALTADVQLLSVVLVIKLQQMQDLDQMEEEFRQLLINELMKLYVPLANRLGIFWVKAEIEDNSLRYINPEIYYELKEKVSKKRYERAQMVDIFTREINQMLEDAQVPHEVYGRYKRFYSIFKKMPKVNYQFDRIHDLIAFRVLTESVQNCYEVLSYIHEKWQPFEGRFKDYIATPKPNGYQSLHTTVDTEQYGKVEIQIRTYEMHQVAEYGVAAHWAYKEGHHPHAKDASLYNRVRELHQDDDLDTAVPSIDLLTDRIYVFTPTRDIIELPQQATAIDFAYAIHSQVGNQITGARRNGQIIKLDEPLQNGDLLEIITSTKQTPRKEWLKTVKTSKAKNKIRYAIREHERDEFRQRGWELLDKEFKNHHLNLNRIFKEGKLEQLARQYKNHSFEHMLISLGEGRQRIDEILKWFVEIDELPAKIPAPRKHEGITAVLKQRSGPILIDGMSNVLVRMAKCCNPEPGDAICGYITRGNGISIHRQECSALISSDNSRLITAYWNEFYSYPVPPHSS
ncbi:MAG: bifunctional (p)ppGpp synthetase/guanosine-3',5'-bis(diphosphate) 3'-pyrophosphohydrolase [SAR324 cluster bacterium]|nr:bifunctional (p)ppGpp synthetase/guanosine-3',5'-bis(diphosphate) 3'-pyrophosphohydrolase [SAR324 cluster bacterium]